LQHELDGLPNQINAVTGADGSIDRPTLDDPLGGLSGDGCDVVEVLVVVPRESETIPSSAVSLSTMSNT
jgi:hypothetical protein